MTIAKCGFIPATIRAITAETADSRIVELAPLQQARIAWKSGQHISLQLTIGGQPIYRTYSLCEASSSGRIKLGVRLLPNGVFSDWLRDAKVGAPLALSRPQGRFYLRPPQQPRARNLFIAAGSGITPIVGMAEEFLAANASAGALLLYANRSTASTMFLERLMQLKNRFMARLELQFFTSREQQAVAWRNARLDADALSALRRKNILTAADYERFYLCGPPAMMESCARFLRDHSADASRIHRETFAPAQTLDKLKPPPAHDRNQNATANITARVSITLNGTRREFDYREDDASVLAAATRHRIALPFACAGGVCGTCRCKILRGRAAMAQNHALESADLAAGFILACQARPQDGELALSFDY